MEQRGEKSPIRNPQKELGLDKAQKISEDEFYELRSKEFDEELDDNEFKTLRAYCLANYFNDHPKKLLHFSPESEIKKLRSVPHEEKKAALDEFKAKLALQREALATCRVWIEETIQHNPDAPEEELKDIVRLFITPFGLNANQINTSFQLIKGYEKQRRYTLSVREMFPDDRQLVYELTHVHVPVSSPLEVSVGPMSIDIATDAKTAAEIQGGREVVENPAKYKTLGFATTSAFWPTIQYTVLNLDLKEHDEFPGTLEHEREHVTNNLLLKHFEPALNFDRFLARITEQANKEQDTDIKYSVLEEYMKDERAGALRRAKDEILAQRKGGSEATQLIFAPKTDSPYDYLAGVREVLIEQEDPVLDKLGEKILVDEYLQTITEGMAAFEALQEHYGRDRTIALLGDKPLIDWYKTAARLLRERRKRK